MLLPARSISVTDVLTCRGGHQKSEVSTLEGGYRVQIAAKVCIKLSNHLQSFRERRRALRSDAVVLQVDVLQRLVDLP